MTSLVPGSPASVNSHSALPPSLPFTRPVPLPAYVSNAASGCSGSMVGSSVQIALVSPSRWNLPPGPPPVMRPSRVGCSSGSSSSRQGGGGTSSVRPAYTVTSDTIAPASNDDSRAPFSRSRCTTSPDAVLAAQNDVPPAPSDTTVQPS